MVAIDRACSRSARQLDAMPIAKSLFNAHAGMRSFMIFPPDRIVVYLDWRTQEVGVAAALADDPALMAAYRGGDVYHAFALSAGVTRDPDPKHWKKRQPDRAAAHEVACQLAINYGMTVPSLARGLDRHPLIASELIERHRRTYPRFWQWREQQVEQRHVGRVGWSRSSVGRSISARAPTRGPSTTFPMQANGAEMLRLAAVRLCEVGLVPSMLVHDGILLEVENEEQIDEAVDVMRWAGRDVCNGFEIGVDIDQKLMRGASYQDKRADRPGDVGDDHGRTADRRRQSAEGSSMTEYVISERPTYCGQNPSRRRATPRRRRTSDPFAQVPLAWAAKAAKATNTKKALVWIELLYATWQSKTESVVLSTGDSARSASPTRRSTGPCASSRPPAWSRWSGAPARHRSCSIKRRPDA